MLVKVSHIIHAQKESISNAPLVVFRLAFGLMMIGSVIRFALNGWIETMYIQPKFHFAYYGFEWIQKPSPEWIYVLFGLILLGAIGITLGALYRISTVIFFLTFTYVELIDKTYYLNHYYFVSLVAFLLIWLPAHRRFSLDVLLFPKIATNQCRRFELSVIRMQVGILYVYAGLAKINSDWLLRAMPLRIWLAANGHLPIIGTLLTKTWVAFLFSWFGMIYDVTIPFFLSLKKTRAFAYLSVIVFHMLTALLFPIGVFPFVMIMSALIFFPIQTHERWLSKMEQTFQFPALQSQTRSTQSFTQWLFASFVIFQLVFPWRYLLYPDNLFWHEQGYRFSWRVMLMEKVGMANFKVIDEKRRTLEIDNMDFLTPLQEKMMATQPDMILQFAHYLEQGFKKEGMSDPKVFVDAYATLNGRSTRRFIDPEVDLSEIKDSWTHKQWILSYE